MFIHMFAFRLKAGVTKAQQERMLREIGDLDKHIPGVLETQVGKNESPRGQGYAIGGVMKFADQSALEAYNAHPAHQESLKWLVRAVSGDEGAFPALYAATLWPA